jgi:hypothetical protein
MDGDVDDAVHAVGSVVADRADRRDLDAVEDHGLEIVDVVDLAAQELAGQLDWSP